jgi:hypothetical protein
MRKNKFYYFLWSFLLVALFGLPLISFADDTDSPIKSVDDIINILKNVVTYLYTAFYIVAVGYILLAAFTFLRAGEDSKKVEEAKGRLKYAVVAIVVALVASGVAKILKNFLEKNKN